MGRCWIPGEWDKTIIFFTSDNGQSFQLYNLTDDPSESLDLSLEFPEIKDTLMNELNKWIISCKQSDRGHDYN